MIAQTNTDTYNRAVNTTIPLQASPDGLLAKTSTLFTALAEQLNAYGGYPDSEETTEQQKPPGEIPQGLNSEDSIENEGSDFRTAGPAASLNTTDMDKGISSQSQNSNYGNTPQTSSYRARSRNPRRNINYRAMRVDRPNNLECYCDNQRITVGSIFLVMTAVVIVGTTMLALYTKPYPHSDCSISARDTNGNRIKKDIPCPDVTQQPSSQPTHQPSFQPTGQSTTQLEVFLRGSQETIEGKFVNLSTDRFA